jgi:hypothetical protein
MKAKWYHMGRNDLFRVGLSICVVAFWVVAGVRMRASPLVKAKGVVTCHMDKGCSAGRQENALDNLVKALSREIECAVATDSIWAMRIPCCKRESLHLTMRETFFRIETLGMRSTYALHHGDSGNFRVTLRQGTGQSAGRQLQFDFIRTGDVYHLQDIQGLCELLTRLSLAAREQSSPRMIEES